MIERSQRLCLANCSVKVKTRQPNRMNVRLPTYNPCLLVPSMNALTIKGLYAWVLSTMGPPRAPPTMLPDIHTVTMIPASLWKRLEGSHFHLHCCIRLVQQFGPSRLHHHEKRCGNWLPEKAIAVPSVMENTKNIIIKFLFWTNVLTASQNFIFPTAAEYEGGILGEPLVVSKRMKYAKPKKCKDKYSCHHHGNGLH